MGLKLSDPDSRHNHIGVISRCVGAGIRRNAAGIRVFNRLGFTSGQSCAAFSLVGQLLRINLRPD
jgi:hypothetical protein